MDKSSYAESINALPEQVTRLKIDIPQRDRETAGMD
jgi:hypothetical protein